MDRIVLAWCEYELSNQTVGSTPDDGRDALAFAACFGSIETMRRVIQSGIPIGPYAMHWVMGQVAYCCALDVEFLRSINERMEILAATGKMRPMDKLLRESVMDIFNNIPVHLKQWMTHNGIHIDTSHFEPSVANLFGELKL